MSEANQAVERAPYNVIIIGSGPAGYTAAIYAARANLNPLLIAGSIKAGGELMNTTEIENFPGFPEGVMGPDFIGMLQKQAERFGAEISFNDVESVNLSENIKRLTLTDGTVYSAKSVIVATGCEYRKLGLEHEKELSGHGVSWCATCDGFFFKDKKVAVIGGGDSAIEEAIFLTKFASKVTVIHRRDKLKASKIMQDRAFSNKKIDFIWDNQVIKLHGEKSFSGCTIKNIKTGNTSKLKLDGMFIAIGSNPCVDLVEDQLELSAEKTIVVNGRTSITSTPGVFAAGDVIDSRYRQAITAAGSGCAAAMDVEEYLNSTL